MNSRCRVRGCLCAVVLLFVTHLTAMGGVGAGFGVIYRDLEHFPLGEAVLDPVGDHLQVSNIGSSGLDGVEVHLGDSMHWDMRIDGPDSEIWSVQAKAHSTVDGVSGVRTAGLDLGCAPDGDDSDLYKLRPDFANVPATGAILFEIYGPDGVLHPLPLPLEKQPEAQWNVDSFFDIHYDIHFEAASPNRECEPNKPACRTRVMFPPELGPVPVTLGGRVFDAIGIGMVYIASPFEPGTTSQNIIAVLIGLQQPGNVTILDENMKNGANLNGVPVVAQGGAKIEARAGGLQVSNIGSSGLDGVHVGFGELKGGFDLEFGPDSGGFQVDSFFDISTEICFEGESTPRPLGNVNFQETDGALQVWADFSPVDLNQVQVEVRQGGNVAGQFTLPTGQSIGFIQSPVGGSLQLAGCGKLGGLGPGQLPCYIFPFRENFLFSPPAGGFVVGNELRVLVPGLPSPPNAIKKAFLRGRDFPMDLASLVRHPPGPQAVAIQQIEPLPNPLGGPQARFVRPRFKLTGRNFPPDPRDLCVLLPIADDLHLPMPVMGIPTPQCAIVELPPLPPLPPEAALGSPIVLLGDGQRLPWTSAFDDGFERWADTFFGRGEGNAEGPPLPDPDPDDDGDSYVPPGDAWFFGRVDENGKLCLELEGDWPSAISVNFSGHLSFLLPGDFLPSHVDLNVPDTFFNGGSTLQDCTDRMADILRCVLRQQLNLEVFIETQVDGDKVKLLISLNDPLGGLPVTIVRGGLMVCVTNVKPAPQVTNVIFNTPGKITEGTVAKIFGSGFGNTVAGTVVYMETTPVPTIMEPVLVTDTCIIAKVGPVRADATPGPIHVLCGQGRVQHWIPAFADLEPETPSEMVFTPPLPPVPFDPFLLPDPPQLIPPPTLPLGVEYLHAQVINGRLCLRLTNDWGPGSSVSMLALFRMASASESSAAGGSPPPPVLGFTRMDRTRLSGDGTRLECARRLQDVLRCAFDQAFTVSVETHPSGDPVIYVWLPGFPFLEGSSWELCIYRPAPPIDITQLYPLTPGPLHPGSLVEICGGPFPPDPRDICVNFGSVFMKPTAVIGDKLIGRIGLAPLGLPPEQFFAAEPGRGFGGPIFPHPDFLLPPVPVDIFIGEGIGLPPEPSPLDVPEILPPPTDPNVTYFPSQPGANGELCLILEGDWCANASINFEGHLVKSRALGLPPLTFDFSIKDLVVPGGPIEECARLVKDLPACAFEQLGRARQSLIWDCEPIGDNNENGLDEWKITVRCPTFDPVEQTGWIGGQMELCVRCPALPLEIKSVSSLDGSTPVCVREGELICIEACNVGMEAKDLCAMIGNEPGNVTPLFVRALDPMGGGITKILAQVGPVPPGAFQAPVYITRGVGNVGIWQPGIATLARPTRPGLVFDSLGNPTAESTTLVWPKPDLDPPTNLECFNGHHNEEMTAICLDLIGSWAPGSLIKVSGHIHVNRDGRDRGRDIQSPITRTIDGGTAEDCAAALKDIFRCQFEQLSDVTDLAFECPDDGDENSNTATFKIVPTVPGTIITGHLQVCVCAPPTPPTITDIETPNPEGVCTGDTVCITGTGFSVDENDYCIIVGTGTDAFRLRVLTATPTKLTCIVEVIPPQLVGSPALPLCMIIANGERVPFVSNVDGVEADANPWVFSNPGGFPSVCVQDALVPIPKAPPEDEEWIHATISENGEICLNILPGVVWGFQQNVSLDGHIFLPPPYGDLDIHSRRVRLRGGGTPNDCALALADILRCVFQQLDGFDLVDIIPTVDEFGGIKITLRWPIPILPNGDPARLDGFLTLCLIDPSPIPSITASPAQIERGVPAVIQGAGFGNDPDDLCVVLSLPDRRRIPLRVVDASDNELTVMPGIIPLDVVGPGCIEVMRGRGQLAQPGDIAFAFPEIQPIDPIWIWEGINPDAKVKGPPDVTPVPTPEDPNERWFHAELVDGKLCLVLRGDWQDNSIVTVTARAHNACQRLDLDGPATRFLGSGDVVACAERLKDLLRCAFLQQTGAVVNISCDPIVGANAVKLTIELENGKPIDWGLCDICVTPRPATSGDTDLDGLSDLDEATLGTDPNNPDTDGDGLFDGQEVNGTGTDPNNADTDGDGCSDAAEIAAGSDPLDPGDCFEVEIVSLDPTTGIIQTCIPETKAGRVYTLCFSENMVDFAPVPGAVDLLPRSIGGQIDVNIPGADETRYFIYVVVRQP